MLLKCIMILLFFLIFVKQIVLIKKLLVPTKKSTLEKIVVTAGVLVLLCITYLFASTFLDYLFAILAITTMLAMFYKQGITGDGLTVLSRGLETYSWEKLGYAKIEEKNVLMITYYSTIGSPIIKQRYAIDKKEQLFSILDQNVRTTK